MGKDVRIVEGNNKFKFRVSGIVEYNNKVLIDKMNNNNFYCFSGGYVEMFEDTKKALKRELKEELYFNAEVKNLLAVNENFYELRQDNYHEICFYYSVEATENNLDLSDKIITEQDKEGMVTHRYKWVDKNELLNYDIKPKQIAEHFLKNNGFKHFITKY